MTDTRVFKSFAEAARALGYEHLDETSPEDRPEHVTAGADVAASAAIDLASLLAGLDAASATLATVVRQDERARALAADELAEHDALAAALAEAERALERAAAVRRRAEELAEAAFAEEARAAAGSVAAEARAAEASAARLVGAGRSALDAFRADHDLDRLLAERRRRDEAERARAAQAARAERLAGALSRARKALATGRSEEARELLGPVANENPGNPEVSSLLEIIARTARERKTAVAEDALWLARRERRHDPAAAVARLEVLDVDGLPQPLAGQVFGCWAEACRRLCALRGLAEPLRYAPTAGRGAVLARDGAGPHTVVSALGMGPPWAAGAVASDGVLRRARPLR